MSKVLPFKYLYEKLYIDNDTDDYVHLLLGRSFDNPRHSRRWYTSLPIARRGITENGAKYVVHKYRELNPEDYIKWPIVSAARGAVTVLYKGEIFQPAMPFAKFFNVGEISFDRVRKWLPSYTTVDAGKLSYTDYRTLPREKYLATKKLDGTLIIVWRDPITNEIRANTRGMLWKNNPFVETFFKTIEYLGMRYELESLVREDRTVMFELVNKELPASIAASGEGYSFDQYWDKPEKWVPYLLCYRRHDTGEIIYDVKTGFPRPERFSNDIESIMEYVERNTSEEGVVLYYPGRLYYPSVPFWNYMVKLKNLAYVLRALAVEGRLSQKYLIKAVAKDYLDDLIPHLNGEMLEFAHKLKERYKKLQDYMYKIQRIYSTATDDRKKKIWNYARHNARFLSFMLTGKLEKLLLVMYKPEKPDKTIKALDRLLVRIDKALPQLDKIARGNKKETNPALH